jgi:hypothetical protein
LAAAQGLQGLLISTAAHGLQGPAAGAIAAHGLQGLTAAHGLQGAAAVVRAAQGLQGLTAAQGLQGLAAAHGLQGEAAWAALVTPLPLLSPVIASWPDEQLSNIRPLPMARLR